MPALLITAIVFAVFATVATVGVLKIRWTPIGKTEQVGVARWAQVTTIAGAWLLVGLLVLLSSLTIVSTRNIGVVTTFNRPTGELTNGLHLKAPWSQITELNGAIQIEKRFGDDNTKVRLGNNSIASVDNTIQWRIKPAAADSLFLDFRTFENIRENLIDRQANAALNDVLSSYNPISSATSSEAGTDNEKLAKRVTDLLRERVGDRVEINSVLIPVINFDQSTQDRLNALNAEVAQTRIAEQKQKTATAEAEANRILSASVNNDPNVLVSKCLDLVKASNQSPLGCWPGSTALPTVGAR